VYCVNILRSEIFWATEWSYAWALWIVTWQNVDLSRNPFDDDDDDDDDDSGGGGDGIDDDDDDDDDDDNNNNSNNNNKFQYVVIFLLYTETHKIYTLIVGKNLKRIFKEETPDKRDILECCVCLCIPLIPKWLCGFLNIWYTKLCVSYRWVQQLYLKIGTQISSLLENWSNIVKRHSSWSHVPK
jgi:hypothetical protein